MVDVNSITDKCCTKCGTVKARTEFNKDKTRKDGLFPQCRDCIKADLKARYVANPESYNKRAKENYQKNKTNYKARARKWEIENRDRKLELRAAYREKYAERLKEIHRLDRIKHHAKRIAAGKKWRQENPAKAAEQCRTRQARKQRAMPFWADRKKMKEIYEECRRITKSTGVKHHVDHYYPLKGVDVCGLHNEYNLRVIPAADNQAKGNRKPE